jgi:hypothetical protein
MKPRGGSRCGEKHTEDPSHESQVEFSWRAEAVVALLWALGGLADRSKNRIPKLCMNPGYAMSWLVGWDNYWDDVPTDA